MPPRAASFGHVLDENPRAIVMYDEATSYRYKPNFHGYRARPTHLGQPESDRLSACDQQRRFDWGDEISSDPALPKILLLGDSVAYGMWVDASDAFSGAHAENWRARAARSPSGACEGWSTKQEIAFFDA
jgi:hypothetical protein